MATIDWKSGADGNWSTAARWDDGAVPSTGDDAVVAAPGAYTVTISQAEAARSLTLNAGSATVADSAALALGSALTVSAGTFELDAGGEIDGGVLSATGGSFDWSGGTLSDATYRGVLTVGDQQSLTVTGGFAITGAAGTGSGLIKIMNDGTFDVAGGETLDNAKIEMGGVLLAQLALSDPNPNSSTVVFGSNLSIVHTGDSAEIVDPLTSANLTLINEGTITAHASSGFMNIYDMTNFTNSGTINVGAGDRLYSHPLNFDNAVGGVVTVSGQNTLGQIVNEGGSWRNEGVISVQNGGVAYLGTQKDGAAPWTNSGTISVGAGGSANLVGNFTTDTLDGVIVNGGTLAVDGVLDNTSSTLQVGVGARQAALVLSYSGVVSGGVVQAAGDALTFEYGTLDNVTYEGPLHIDQTFEAAYIKDAINLTTFNGSGDGEIDLTGQNASLYASGTLTLDHATLNIGADDGRATLIEYPQYYGASGTLTLGADFNVVQTGRFARIEAFYDYDATPEVVLDGSLTAGVSGGSFSIEVGKLTNNGQITVSGGDDLGAFGYVFDNAAAGTISVTGSGTVANLSGETGFDNAGSITVGSGSEGVISDYVSGAFDNTGSISVAQGGELEIDITGVTSDLQSISNSGLLIDESVIDNSGAVFTVGSGGLGDVSLRYGTINGGTVVDTKGELDVVGGRLQNLTYEGVLSLADANTYAFLDAVSMTGSGGTGAGLIKLTGAGATAYVGSTLDNAVLDIGSSKAVATLAVTDFGNGRSVTFGSGLQVVQTGALAAFAPNDPPVGSTIVNEGSITAAFAGGTLTIQETRFTNDGSLRAGKGETVGFGSTILTNYSGGTLTGGRFEADAGSTIEFRAGETVVRDDGTLVLNGAGSAIQSPGSTSGSQVGPEQTLAQIGTGGVLEVLGGRDWNGARRLNNLGELDLGGGDFDAPALANSGRIEGFGVIGSALVNKGVVEATGGSLEIAGRTGGGGVLDIDTRATLQFDAMVNAGVRVGFTGTKGVLALKDASTFGGQITGLASNAVDLLAVQATAATLEGGGRLVVTDNGAVVATLRLTDSYAGELFKLASDGNGGTDITVKAAAQPAAAAAASLVQASAAFGASTSPGGGATSGVAAVAGAMLAPPLLHARA